MKKSIRRIIYLQAILSLILLSQVVSATEELTVQSLSKTALPSETVQQHEKYWFEFQQIVQGAKIFQENCATCHGKKGEGAINWRKEGPDGKYPAPPLNGTGHAWHHPRKMLFYVIKNGSPGGGTMPAWKEKLSNDEILSVIAWFQSKWPEEIYDAWAKHDKTQRLKTE